MHTAPDHFEIAERGDGPTLGHSASSGQGSFEQSLP